jgi:hypothetical protein
MLFYHNIQFLSQGNHFGYFAFIVGFQNKSHKLNKLERQSYKNKQSKFYFNSRFLCPRRSTKFAFCARSTERSFVASHARQNQTFEALPGMHQAKLQIWFGLCTCLAETFNPVGYMDANDPA